MHVEVLWVVTPCSVLVGYHRIRGPRWRWRQHGPLKFWYPATSVHGVAIKNSNLHGCGNLNSYFEIRGRYCAAVSFMVPVVLLSLQHRIYIYIYTHTHTHIYTCKFPRFFKDGSYSSSVKYCLLVFMSIAQLFFHLELTFASCLIFERKIINRDCSLHIMKCSLFIWPHISSHEEFWWISVWKVGTETCQFFEKGKS
jgi:hypothetical protein